MDLTGGFQSGLQAMGAKGPQRHAGKSEQAGGNQEGTGRGFHEETECADIPVENKHGLHPAGNWWSKPSALAAKIMP
jgi:hypothetical protein